MLSPFSFEKQRRNRHGLRVRWVRPFARAIDHCEPDCSFGCIAVDPRPSTRVVNIFDVIIVVQAQEIGRLRTELASVHERDNRIKRELDTPVGAKLSSPIAIPVTTKTTTTTTSSSHAGALSALITVRRRTEITRTSPDPSTGQRHLFRFHFPSLSCRDLVFLPSTLL